MIEGTERPRSDAPEGLASPPEITMWAFLNVLLRHRRLVFGVPMLGALVTAAISLAAPREYVASASFVVEGYRGQQSNLAVLANQFGLGGSRVNSNSPEFYAYLVESREVLRSAVMTPLPVSGGSRPVSLVSYFGSRNTVQHTAVAGAVDQLKRKLHVTWNRATGVVTFDVSLADSSLARATVDTILSDVDSFSLARRQSQSRADREFVAGRMSEAQAALRGAEDRLADFARRNRGIANAPELQAEQARLQRDVMLRQQLYENLVQSYDAASIEEARNSPTIAVVERPGGFVAAKSRNVLLRTTAAVFILLIVAVPLAFVREGIERARRTQLPEYLEFRQLRRRIFRRPAGDRAEVA